MNDEHESVPLAYLGEVWVSSLRNMSELHTCGTMRVHRMKPSDFVRRQLHMRNCLRHFASPTFDGSEIFFIDAAVSTETFCFFSHSTAFLQMNTKRALTRKEA